MSGYEIQGKRRGTWMSLGSCQGESAAETLADSFRSVGRFEDVRVQPPEEVPAASEKSPPPDPPRPRP